MCVFFVGFLLGFFWGVGGLRVCFLFCFVFSFILSFFLFKRSESRGLSNDKRFDLVLWVRNVLVKNFC